MVPGRGVCDSPLHHTWGWLSPSVAWWLQVSAVLGLRQLESIAHSNPVTGAGSGTRWARRAAQGNLPHPEQARTARPPPRALAAWHVSLLLTACQKNSLAAWKRARLSRQCILTPPARLSLKSLQTNRGASPLPPRSVSPCSRSDLGLEQPGLSQSILLPPTSPVPAPQPLLKHSTKDLALASWAGQGTRGRIRPPNAQALGCKQPGHLLEAGLGQS